MANLKPALTPDEVKKAGVSNIRTAYNNLAENYNRILDRDLILCPSCGDFLKAETSYYKDLSYATGKYPICKRCIMKIVEQRKTDKDPPNETKESVQKVLQMMNKVYDDTFYNDCVKGALDEAKERNRSSPFATYITAVSSLPNWKGKTWADSDFGDSVMSLSEEEINENSRILKTAKKRFGKDYSSADLMWLEGEYQDWITRYPCESKAQELLFKRICLNELKISKAEKEGKETKEYDKTLQDLMSSLQIKPSQNTANALTEAKTFGQLIQKWEDEYDGGKPIPEPDDDFKDVDKVGFYIDVFFKGHLSKAMSLKNGFSKLYDSFMKKISVSKPEYDEDTDTEVLFDQIFGSRNEEQ